MTDVAAQTESAHRKFAPINKVKTKPRTHQPKKVKFVSTEIRCQEKTKGGVCYEVILAEPEGGATVPPAVANRRPTTPPEPKSIQDIADKLKAAEERRQSLGANKMAALQAKMLRIEEASKKKDEQTNQFIAATKEALDQKMEVHVEKREAYISDLRTKLKDHIDQVEKTRLTLEQQTDEVRKAIEEKLQTASAQRDENIKKMLERLKEHEDQVIRVRTTNTEKFKQINQEIQEKLESAEQRRQRLEKEQLEKLRNHNTVQIEKVKQQLNEAESEEKRNERVKDIEQRLSMAEINRERQLQKKIEIVKKQEKRAETVRQNKAQIASGQMTASSG